MIHSSLHRLYTLYSEGATNHRKSKDNFEELDPEGMIFSREETVIYVNYFQRLIIGHHIRNHINKVYKEYHGY